MNPDLLKELPPELFPGVLYIYDLQDNRNFFINAKFEEILGYTNEQIQAMGGDLMSRIIHPDDKAKVQGVMDELARVRPGDVVCNEYRIKDARGRWHWFRDTACVTAVARDGSIKQVVGTALDITEFKDTESPSEGQRRTMRQNERLLRVLLSALPLSIYWKDRSGRYLGCNDHYKREIRMRQRDDIIGKTDAELELPEAYVDHLRRRERKVLETGVADEQRVESRLNSKGDETLHEVNRVPMLDESGDTIGILCTHEDVTEKIRAQQQAKKSELEAEKAQKDRDAAFKERDQAVAELRTRKDEFDKANPDALKQMVARMADKDRERDEALAEQERIHREHLDKQERELKKEVERKRREFEDKEHALKEESELKEARLKDEFEKERQAFDRDLDKYKSEVEESHAAYERDLDTLEKALEERDRQIGEKQKQVAALNEEIEAQSAKLNRQQGLLEETEHDRKEQAQEIESLKADKEEATTRIKTLTEERDSLRQAQQSLSNELNKLKEQHEQLRDTLSDKDNKHYDLQKSLDSNRLELKSAQEKLSDLEGAAKESQALIAELKESIGFKAKALEAREQEVATLKAALDKARKQALEHESRADELAHELEGAKNSYKESESQHHIVIEKQRNELAAATRRYDLLLESSGDGVVIVDAESGIIEQVNAEMERMVGLTRNELIGSLIIDIHSPEEREETRVAFRQRVTPIIKAWREGDRSTTSIDGGVLFWGDSTRTEYILRHKNGTDVPVENHTKVFEWNGRLLIRGNMRDISKRVEIRKRIEEANKRFSHHLQTMPLAYIEWDVDLNILDWNESAQRIFGYTKEEVLGKDAFETIVPADIREYVQKEATKISQNTRPHRLTNENVQKDGTRIICEWYNTPIYDSSGEFVAIASIANDVTQQRQAEVELRRSEQRFKQMFMEHSAIMYISDTNSLRMLDVNTAALDYYGYTREQFLKFDLTDINAEDPEEYRKSVALAKEGKKRTFIFRHKLASGEVRDVEVYVTLIDIRGETVFFSIVHDVTERKLAEERLRRSEERWQLAFEGSRDGVWDADLVTGKVYYSARWGEMLGLKPDEIKAERETFHSRLHPDEKEHVEKHMADHINGKTDRIDVELRLRHADGSWVWVLDRGRAIYGKDGKAIRVVGTHTDITALKEYQRQITKAKEEAEEASRTKSAFLANISHEIRTPLNAVIGFSGLLQGTELDGEQRDFVERINTSGNILLEILNAILDLSRIESGRVELESLPVNARDFTEEIVTLFSARAREKKIEIKAEVSDSVPQVVGVDPTRLRQILINLVSNAVKFTHQGAVRLTLDAEERNDDHVTLVYQVIDTGIGINKEKLEHIFEAFSQADSTSTRKYGGAGLGLTISRGLANLLDGDITVSSEQEVGSTFTFRFRAEVYEADTVPPEIMNRQAAEPTIPAVAPLVDLESISMPPDAEDALPEKSKDKTLSQAKTPASPDEKKPQASDSGQPPVNAIKTTTVEKNKEAETPSEQPQPDESSDPLVPGRPVSKRILVAEDNFINQQVARTMLHMFGYEPVVVTNGQQVLDKLKEEDFPVILMDIHMPGMDGFEATREIRKLEGGKPQPRIIAVTAAILPKDKQTCFDAGMDAYISKPIKKEVLQEAIEEQMQAYSRQ